MTMIFIALADGLLVLHCQHGHWQVQSQMEGLPTQCVAADPLQTEHVYCGTFGRGLWRSMDAGATWQPVGEGIRSPQIMAVAVSRAERVGAYGVVYAGTEPSGLYRSEDGGKTWQELTSLLTLPSAPT
jgi:hypothetical protein